MPTPKSDRCWNCGEPNKDRRSATCGRQECKDAKLKGAIPMLRWSRIEAGVCFVCGGPKTSEARECCECRENRLVRTSRLKSRRLDSGKCLRCSSQRGDHHRYCDRCRTLEADYARSRQDRLKLAAMNAYGGAICGCCGEKCLLMLSLDHINQDGAQHRRENTNATGSQFYAMLAKEGYPPGFRVLCYNCVRRGR